MCGHKVHHQTAGHGEGGTQGKVMELHDEIVEGDALPEATEDMVFDGGWIADGDELIKGDTSPEA